MLESLIDSFAEDELTPELSSIDYDSHTGETDLIDALVGLNPDPVRMGGGELRVETYQMHGSPKIDYTLPNGVNVRKEIADVFFDAETLLPGSDDHRRAFLAQAKFDTAGSSWKVDTSQFRFIHQLPVFVVSRPKTAHSFNLEPYYMTDSDREYTGNTFAVGLFGSTGGKPFFLRTERILQGIPHVEGASDLRYQRSAEHSRKEETFSRSEFGSVAGYDYINSVLKNFLKRQYGQPVADDSELERFVTHIEDIATSDTYGHLHHKDLCTDGGEERGGLVYVKFTIDLRDAQYDPADGLN
jgi:hypothetical protein